MVDKERAGGRGPGADKKKAAAEVKVIHETTYGTEAVQSTGAPLRRWKAAAVMRMLIKKVCVCEIG